MTSQRTKDKGAASAAPVGGKSAFMRTMFAHRMKRPELIPISEFICAVESGEPPDPVTMKLLATALAALFEHGDQEKGLREVGRRLGLTQKQGTHPLPTRKEVEPAICATARMLQRERELRASGIDAAKARSTAIKECQEKLGLKTPRTPQQWRNQYEKHAQQIVDLLDYAEQFAQ